MDLRATKSFRYARRDLVAGDIFEAASAGDARVLTRMGRAERVPTPEQESEPELEKAPRKRGTYRTRRLTAEDANG